MKCLILIMILGLYNTPSELQSNLEPVIKEYLLVKEALVKGNSEGAYSSSQTLLAAVEQNTLSNTELINAAKKIAGSKDLQKQRAAFAVLSVSLWEQVKQSEYGKGTLYYQYCPMKKAYWLSAAAEIENPYFGMSMLRCGSIADKMN